MPESDEGWESNAVFTWAVNLVDQLQNLSDVHAPWVKNDLVVAAGELRQGPWQHTGQCSPDLALPFTVQCCLLDELLARLAVVTHGLGARVAVERTQRCLRPDQPGRTVSRSS